MRVKPYAIRFPSRNARHTALSAPGGRISTSGCSCRYRSSLRTRSSGPGGTSCTRQYRYPASGQRNGFPKSPATRHRRGHQCLPPSSTRRRMTNPVPPLHLQPLPDSTPNTTGLATTHERWSGCSRRNRTQASPLSCRKEGVARVYKSACRINLRRGVARPCLTQSRASRWQGRGPAGLISGLKRKTQDLAQDHLRDMTAYAFLGNYSLFSPVPCVGLTCGRLVGRRAAG
jgi:hypothetical protein